MVSRKPDIADPADIDQRRISIYWDYLSSFGQDQFPELNDIHDQPEQIQRLFWEIISQDIDDFCEAEDILRNLVSSEWLNEFAYITSKIRRWYKDTDMLGKDPKSYPSRFALIHDNQYFGTHIDIRIALQELREAARDSGLTYLIGPENTVKQFCAFVDTEINDVISPNYLEILQADRQDPLLVIA